MNLCSKSGICAATLAALLVTPPAAWAKPDVKIAIKAEKEVIVKENGVDVKKIVEAKEIAPGEIVTYTLSYSNTGDSPAKGVAIVDPIPEGTSYLPGSATELGELTFSIDQGKSYKKPSLLSYEVTNPDGRKEKRTASPEEYTHIKWTLPSVGAGEKGTVSFKVKVR